MGPLSGQGLGGDGLVPAPDNAVTKSPDLTVSLGVDSSTAPKHKGGHCLSVNRVLDDNANIKYPSINITLIKAGRTVIRTILPEGHVYDEELIPLPLVVLSGEDVSSVVLILSEPWSDDNGHSECTRMGYCQDDYFSKDRKDSDATVVDVFNTNQALFPGKRVSEDKSSREEWGGWIPI